MARNDRSHGVWFQSGRKAGSNARKNRTKHGGKYAIKNGAIPSQGKRKNGRRSVHS